MGSQGGEFPLGWFSVGRFPEVSMFEKYEDTQNLKILIKNQVHVDLIKQFKQMIIQTIRHMMYLGKILKIRRRKNPTKNP